jgi:cation diffusion facilitator CzcD-associated flavoprotein CzcO
MPQSAAPVDVEVAIVGAGFSGIAMAVELDRAGISDFVLLERGPAAGGTWRDNSYPGAACDIPSHLYSFSFEPKPDWSRHFAPQPEIEAYLRHCLAKYGLAGRLHTGQEVVTSHFDEAAKRWRVVTRAGQHYRARALVLGHGPLSEPVPPELPGLADFQGQVFHSARWPASFDAAGLRVAVIGTGASAVQIVPALARTAGRLAVYQRTPPWILPRGDRALPAWRARAFAAAPRLQRAYRDFLYWRYELRALGFTVHRALLAPARWMALGHLRRQVADAGLRQRLTPGYAVGCKRILLSDDYYPALQQPQVELVTAPIERVTAQGIVTAGGRLQALDAIVLATGFAASAYLARFDVIGRGGQRLAEAGASGALLGITVSGFPNLFLLMGPNTGLGHNSMIFMIEAQARYVRRALEGLRAAGRDTLEPLAEVQRRHGEAIERRLADSVWNSGCRSWYLHEGRNLALWPGSTVEYWWRTRRWRAGDYRLD